VNQEGKQLRFLDLLVIVIVAAAAVLSGFMIYGQRDGRLHLSIEAPSGSWIYELGTDRTVRIPGQLGDTVVRIKGGSARIAESPCPNQTCVAAAPVSRRGEWAACLPNRVIIRIEGEEGGVDAVGY
jgi:Uncharacterized protein conserved in bacteria